jgi:hypothetical protein
MANTIISLLEAQEKKSRQYYINNTRQRTEPFEVLFSARQTNRRKLDKLFGEWICVLVYFLPLLILFLKLQKSKPVTSFK